MYRRYGERTPSVSPLARIFHQAALLYLLLASSGSSACEIERRAEREAYKANTDIPWQEFQNRVGKHTFFGLASYYNGVSFHVVGNGVFQSLEPGEAIVLKNGSWLAAVARLEVVLVQSPGLSFRLREWEHTLSELQTRVAPGCVKLVRKSELQSLGPELHQLRYAHLWAPLSWLAKVVEYSLIALHAHLVNHWGLAIVLLSLLLKFVLFPVQVLVAHKQQKVGRIRSMLEPQLAEIKSNHDGEQAHRRIMAAHKALGVTPFYPLSPLLGLLIQFPIWIAVFNALGEMPQLAGQSFLWIEDLAYPDVVAAVPFNVPLFGSTVHLLPLLMTAVSFLAVRMLPSEGWSKREYARQRRNLCWTAVVFLLLFYPFPAAMVLYWTLNNLFQILLQPAVRALIAMKQISGLPE